MQSNGVFILFECFNWVFVIFGHVHNSESEKNINDYCGTNNYACEQQMKAGPQVSKNYIKHLVYPIRFLHFAFLVAINRFAYAS